MKTYTEATPAEKAHYHAVMTWREKDKEAYHLHIALKKAKAEVRQAEKAMRRADLICIENKEV